MKPTFPFGPGGPATDKPCSPFWPINEMIRIHLALKIIFVSYLCRQSIQEDLSDHPFRCFLWKYFVEWFRGNVKILVKVSVGLFTNFQQKLQLSEHSSIKWSISLQKGKTHAWNLQLPGKPTAPGNPFSPLGPGKPLGPTGPGKPCGPCWPIKIQTISWLVSSASANRNVNEIYRAVPASLVVRNLLFLLGLRCFLKYICIQNDRSK